MRLITLLLAIGFGLYGVITNQYLWALVCAGLVFLAFTDFYSTSIQADLARAGRWGRSFFASGWGLFLVAGLAFSALATTQSRGDDQSRTTVWFWLIALVLVIAAALAHDLEERARRRAASAENSETAISPVSSAVKQRWGLLDWGLVVAAMVVAAVLRIYGMNEFLPPMHGDEGEMGLRALLALHGPAAGTSEKLLPFFGGSFLDHPTLFHYLQAGALALFGENIWGLRMLSVIFGVLCVPALYGLGWVGWGRIAAFMAAWLMAVSHLFIQFSRIALNNIETVFMTVVVVWLMALGRRKTHWWADGAPVDVGLRQTPLIWFALAGLAAGVSQYFYYGSRLIPILMVVFVIFLWFERRITLRQIVVMGLAFFVAYLPLAEFYTRHFAAFINRTRGVSVFGQEGIQHALGVNAVWPRDLLELLQHQVEVNLGMFVHGGDASAFYFRDIAMFDPITALLFWLGIGVVLARLRRYYDFSVFVWFAVGVLLAGVLTNDPPNAPRLIVAAPAVFVIAGVFCQRVVDLLGQSEVKPAAAAVAVSGVIIASTTLYLNYNTYFVTYANLAPNQIPISVANEMATYADDRAFLIGAPNLYADYSTLRFIAGATERHDAESADQIIQAQEQAGDDKGLLVIALPHRLADLEALRQRLPGGEWNNHVDAAGRPLFSSYRAP